MSDPTQGAYAVLAEAFHYPFPGLLGKLQGGIQVLPQKLARQAFQTFVQSIHRLTLGEWEELYTRTLDLNPAVAPYLGYQLWGDGYPRGNFMAALNRAYRAAGIEVGGDLPDHMGVVLMFLASGARPPSELVEAFEPAVQKMLTTLRKTEVDNPYILLFEAVIETVDLKDPQTV